jgi:hypothetical protein
MSQRCMYHMMTQAALCVNHTVRITAPSKLAVGLVVVRQGSSCGPEVPSGHGGIYLCQDHWVPLVMLYVCWACSLPRASRHPSSQLTAERSSFHP